jgi:hypothetical protein
MSNSSIYQTPGEFYPELHWQSLPLDKTKDVVKGYLELVMLSHHNVVVNGLTRVIRSNISDYFGFRIRVDRPELLPVAYNIPYSVRSNLIRDECRVIY